MKFFATTPAALAGASLFLCLASSMMTSPASALLFEIDLAGGNLNEVTRDTLSGLDWLDVVETANVSFNDAVAVATGSFGSGWRHATSQELCDLFAAYALDPACTGSPASGTAIDTLLPHTENEALIAVLGATFVDLPLQNRVRGYFDDQTAAPTVGFGELRSIFLGGGQQSGTAVTLDGASAGTISPSVGNFLVRPVPEPSTGLLVGFGLLALRSVRARARSWLPDRVAWGR